MRTIVSLTLLALCTSGCAGVAMRAVAAARTPDPAQLLRNADANGDGMITEAEFRDARAKLFARLDRDGDGFLTNADTPRRLAARRAGGGDRLAEAMRGLDKDGDGKVSRDEFVNSPGLIFQRADANRDGVVDRQELEAFQAAAVARRSQ